MNAFLSSARVTPAYFATLDILIAVARRSPPAVPHGAMEWRVAIWTPTTGATVWRPGDDEDELARVQARVLTDALTTIEQRSLLCCYWRVGGLRVTRRGRGQTVAAARGRAVAGLAEWAAAGDRVEWDPTRCYKESAFDATLAGWGLKVDSRLLPRGGGVPPDPDTQLTLPGM